MPELQEYRAAIVKIDVAAKAVEQRRAADMVCARGCSACCVEGLSVLPVEAESIVRFVEDNALVAPPQTPGSCAFLDQAGACTIYPVRPVVCRTHGLPLQADGDMSHCQLNFTQRPPETADILDATQLQMLLTVVDTRFHVAVGLSADAASDVERIPLAALAATAATTSNPEMSLSVQGGQRETHPVSSQVKR